MKADGSPEKEFFVSMITKDIGLKRAILDLVDNSVDSFYGSKKKKKEIRIHIDSKSDKFSISDNGHGITPAIAKKYAFRFGRPSNDTLTESGIGLFGIGMKRAIFKIGKKFVLSTTSAEGSVSLDVDINNWLKKKDDWSFENLQVNKQKVSRTGTTIEINQINKEIRDEFSKNKFVDELYDEISKAHSWHIGKGLIISINDLVVEPINFQIKNSKKITPEIKKFNIDGVDVTLIVGVGGDSMEDKRYQEAGWYIFCNHRLVVEADSTYKTGWGDGIPKMHPNFGWFRGYIFLESENPELIPWNTTKTGLDLDNSLYKSLKRNHMIPAAKKILTLCREATKERRDFLAERIKDTPLVNELEKSKEISLVKLDQSENKDFTYPRFDLKKISKSIQRICFDAPSKKVEYAMKLTGAASFAELGKASFNYFYIRECEEDE
ncbi:MAG: ATP-binding protein [Bacteriovoracaceae bacterium]|jgi:hypothetical protein|nr:ATP-binding protein [Bacteriovoracaceae bacterium]